MKNIFSIGYSPMYDIQKLRNRLYRSKYNSSAKNISELVGQILTSIINDENKTLFFITSTNEVYALTHFQSCCEDVSLDDICGDLSDLLNTPILSASMETSNQRIKVAAEYNDTSFTWTFYKLATINGSVTLRWYGASNRYYSEEVDFLKIY